MWNKEAVSKIAKKSQVFQILMEMMNTKFNLLITSNCLSLCNCWYIMTMRYNAFKNSIFSCFLNDEIKFCMQKLMICFLHGYNVVIFVLFYA